MSQLSSSESFHQSPFAIDQPCPSFPSLMDAVSQDQVFPRNTNTDTAPLDCNMSLDLGVPMDLDFTTDMPTSASMEEALVYGWPCKGIFCPWPDCRRYEHPGAPYACPAWALEVVPPSPSSYTYHHRAFAAYAARLEGIDPFATPPHFSLAKPPHSPLSTSAHLPAGLDEDVVIAAKILMLLSDEARDAERDSLAEDIKTKAEGGSVDGGDSSADEGLYLRPAAAASHGQVHQIGTSATIPNQSTDAPIRRTRQQSHAATKCNKHARTSALPHLSIDALEEDVFGPVIRIDDPRFRAAPVPEEDVFGAVIHIDDPRFRATPARR